jgi:hypothetical protein
MTTTKKRNKKGGLINTANLTGLQNTASQKFAGLQEQAGSQFSGLQEQAGSQLSVLQEQAGKQFSGLQGQVKSLIPQMSVTGLLKKAFGLNDEQLEALGKADPAILQRAFWQSLNEKKWALVTSALGFIPFIGQDFLAAKSVYREAREVLTDSTKKVQAFLPKSDEMGIEMQNLSSSSPSPIAMGGGTKRKNSTAILRRIEKSKKAFHKTNKHKKPRKTQRRRNRKSRT